MTAVGTIGLGAIPPSATFCRFFLRAPFKQKSAGFAFFLPFCIGLLNYKVPIFFQCLVNKAGGVFTVPDYPLINELHVY